MIKELVFLVVSIIAGTLGILFSNALWDFVGVHDPHLRNHLVIVAGYFPVFVGFLCAIYSLLDRTRDSVRKLLPELRSIARREVVTFYKGIDGLNLVADRVHQLRRVLNTRIIPRDYAGQLYSGDATRWNRSIADGVKNGIEFVDIASGVGFDSAAQIGESLRTHELSGLPVRGRYTAIKIECDLRSFLNFKVLEFKDGTKEVWVGWRVSNTSTIDAPCFRSTDARMIKLFEEWHRDLANSGVALLTLPNRPVSGPQPRKPNFWHTTKRVFAGR